MWRKSEHCGIDKPAEVERSGDIVFVRREFEFHEAQGEDPEKWTYLEVKMSPTEYELYEDNVALRDYLDMIS